MINVTPPPKQNERYELRIHEVEPGDIIPSGDRYVVEVIDIDEKIELGQILVMTQDPKIDPKDPKADPNIEVRGVLVGVIVSRGNGHLLGLPDPALVQRDLSGHDTVVRAHADVPMFFAPGDVVFVDRNAKGRALKILGREIRIIAQIDVLASLRGVRLVRGENGWEQETADASE